MQGSSHRSDLVTTILAGPNLCHKRNQARYIKERDHVAQTGYYNRYCLVIDGSRLIRSVWTDCFRQKLLAERGRREPSAAERRVGWAVVRARPRQFRTAAGGHHKWQCGQWTIPRWPSP